MSNDTIEKLNKEHDKLEESLQTSKEKYSKDYEKHQSVVKKNRIGLGAGAVGGGVIGYLAGKIAPSVISKLTRGRIKVPRSISSAAGAGTGVAVGGYGAIKNINKRYKQLDENKYTEAFDKVLDKQYDIGERLNVLAGTKVRPKMYGAQRKTYGTGPTGQGPMTGRAAGLCAGNDEPGFLNR